MRESKKEDREVFYYDWLMMINKIIDYLDYLFPNPKCELEYNKDYELLLAIVMSAQTTDKRVNMVNKVYLESMIL